MDQAQLIAAVRYIALKPVRAKLVTQATAWPWSSAAALAARRNDVLVKVRPVLKRIGDFAEFMGQPEDSELRKAPERGLSVGRPLTAVTALASGGTAAGRCADPAQAWTTTRPESGAYCEAGVSDVLSQLAMPYGVSLVRCHRNSIASWTRCTR